MNPFQHLPDDRPATGLTIGQLTAFERENFEAAVKGDCIPLRQRIEELKAQIKEFHGPSNTESLR